MYLEFETIYLSTSDNIFGKPSSFCLYYRQLCLLLNAEHIYRALAKILLEAADMKFATTMVQTLNTILLTSTELFELRTKLKDLQTEVRWLNERHYRRKHKTLMLSQLPPPKRQPPKKKTKKKQITH